jgi:hypothetical protein
VVTGSLESSFDSPVCDANHLSVGRGATRPLLAGVFQKRMLIPNTLVRPLKLPRHIGKDKVEVAFTLDTAVALNMARKEDSTPFADSELCIVRVGAEP